jgi:DnaJ-class molecular chaperone
MVIEGATIHDKCDGLGVIEKDGKGEVCEGCMGTGMITSEVEV